MRTNLSLLAALIVLVLFTDTVCGHDIHLLAVATNRSDKGEIHAFDHFSRTVRRTWAKHHTGRFRAKSLLGEEATGKPSHVITFVGYDKAKKEVYCINSLLAAPGIETLTNKEFEKVWNSKGVGSDARNAVVTDKIGKDAIVPT